MYQVTTRLNTALADVQVSTLTYSMEPEAEQVYKSFAFEDEDQANDYDQVETI